jgi:hypothetical protein
MWCIYIMAIGHDGYKLMHFIIWSGRQAFGNNIKSHRLWCEDLTQNYFPISQHDEHCPMLVYKILIVWEKSLQKTIEVLKELYKTSNREMSILTARERTSFYIFMMILLLFSDLKYFLFIETDGPIVAITLNTSENTTDASCDVNEQSE